MKNLRLHGIYLGHAVEVRLGSHIVARLDVGNRKPEQYGGAHVSIDTAIGYLIEDVVAEWLQRRLA